MIQAAVDLGASSGRLLLEIGLEDRIFYKEIRRFKTPSFTLNGRLFWDVDRLLEEIILGLKEARHLGYQAERLCITSFGVDYALLDENGHLIGEGVSSYRDPKRGLRGQKEFLTPEKQFLLSGVQPQIYNSIYSLYEDYKDGRLDNVAHILMLPAYLSYRLTGVMANEVSSLSTSGILDVKNCQLIPQLLETLNLKEDVFLPLYKAGTLLGKTNSEISEKIGYALDVYLTLGHDTAAAFYGSNAKEDELLLSSGTWSLLGSYLSSPLRDLSVYKAGFTNELSYPGMIRFLKNIPGMYIVNRTLAELPGNISPAKAVEMARAVKEETPVFDPCDDRFLNPESMIEEIKKALRENGFDGDLEAPVLFKTIYTSLAISYAHAIQEIESLTGHHYKTLVIFGGGSKNELLNELTCKIAKVAVFKGPSEATSLGALKAIKNK